MALLAALCLSPPAPEASAGTVWKESGDSGFPNGTLDGTALRSPDGALVLDRGDLLGSGGNWRLLDSGPPAPRVLAGMAYDPVRRVSVLFGGNGASNDTWEYDSEANLWKSYRTDPAPSARYASGMTYHAGAGVVVLFGGVAGSTYVNDTWAYEAGAHRWTRKSPPVSPSGRYSCGLAYDGATGLIVLFGGYDSSARGDTWVYDLYADNWTQRTPQPAPSARFMHSMAAWPTQGTVVLFGGYGKGDLWTYNVSGDAWTQETSGAIPSPRSAALMVYIEIYDIMVLFGGFGSGAYLQDTWYAPNNRPLDWAVLATSNPPPGRDSAAGAYDVSAKCLVVFGGAPGFAPSPPLGDTWTLNLSRPAQPWRAMVPTARSGHSMCYDESAGKAVVFGGRDSYESYKSDTWLFDAGKSRWSSATPSTRPQPRYLAAMAYDSARRVSVLFGGQWPVLGDTWTYDASAGAWTNRTPAGSPPARYSSAMVFDPFNGVCLLFGGGVAAGRVGDTWAYNASTNAWTDLRPALAPPARSGHALAFDRQNRVAVLFGGSDGQNRADTWTYDYARNLWTNVTPAVSPSARTGTSLVYDESHGLLVLFGGRDASGPLNDTWLFEPRSSTWTNLKTPAAPGVRGTHGAIYDRAQNLTLLFGGGAGTSHNGDVWTFPADLGFCPSGRFVSAPRDTGGESHFGTVRANFTVPATGSLRIRLRTANSSAALGTADFVGPDGTNSTWYLGGERVHRGQSPARWVQYSVEMATTGRESTPALSDIHVSYNRMHYVTLYSPSGGEQWLGQNNITWNALDPDGDRLLFDVYLSKNGGATYPILLASNLEDNFLVWNTSSQPAGRSFRIKVVARDDDAQIPLTAETSSGLNFAILRPNVLPRAELLLPPPGAFIRGGEVRLSWTGSDDDRDPLVYYLIMDGVVHARVEGTGFSAANLSDGRHRWSVIPNDGYGNGTCLSGKWNFTLSRNLPPAVTLVAPADGSVVRTGSTALTWSGKDGEGDGLSYRVFVNGKDLGTTDSSSFEIGNLSNGTYRWTVVVSDPGGNGSCLSGTWTFQVRLNLAPDIFLLHPMNGSTVNSTTVQLRWTGMDPEGDRLEYTLELNDGAGHNLTETLTASDRTLELSDRTGYSWRVIVSDGIDTVASPSSSFTVRVNRRPVIHSVPVLEATPGKAYVYRVVATDPDSDRLRFSLAEMPGGMGIDRDGKVLWVPSAGQAGKAYRVAITASDGELEERQEFTIRVGKAPPPAPSDATGPPLWLAAALALVLALEIAAVRFLWKGGRIRE